MNLLRNVSIGVRLGLGFAVILLFSMLITGISVWRLHDVASATRVMMEQPLAKERYISDWYGRIDSAVRRTIAIARSSDTSLSGYFAEESKVSSASSAELQKKIEALIDKPEEKAMFAGLLEQRKVYIGSRDQVYKLKGESQVEAANEVFEKTFVPAAAKYQKMVSDLLAHQRDDRRDGARDRCRGQHQPQPAADPGSAGAGLWRRLRLAADDGHRAPPAHGRGDRSQGGRRRPDGADRRQRQG